jgi:MFS family permease
VRLPILRDRNLAILFVGQAVNVFGSTMLIIVLPIWVKDLTGSTSAAGSVFLLLALAVLLAPMSGLVVDRFPRRWVLLVNDAVTGLLVLSLLTVQDAGDVWVIYVVTFGYGFSGQIYRGARGGLLHSMLPEDLLGDANGLFSSLSQGMRIIGPVVGAGIYVVAGGGVVAVVDVTTFVVAAVSYLLLRRVPDVKPVREQSAPFFAELAAGVRHVVGHPVIRRLVVAAAVAFAGAGMVNVALFALVEEGLRRPTAIIGVLGGMQGAGSVLAGFLVGPALRRYGEYAVGSVGFLLNGIGLAAFGSATLGGVVVGAALVGLGLPLVLVAELTLVQRRTPAELQGRAIVASDAIIDVPFAAAIGVGALVVNSIGYRPIYVGVATSFTVVGLVLLRYRSLTRPAGEASLPSTASTVQEPAPP